MASWERISPHKSDLETKNDTDRAKRLLGGRYGNHRSVIKHPSACDVTIRIEHQSSELRVGGSNPSGGALPEN